MLGDSVPEMECSIRAGRTEGPVDGVEGYRVYGIHVSHVVGGWVAVTFEGEIHTEMDCISEGG